jgi:hypothetical protein
VTAVLPADAVLIKHAGVPIAIANVFSVDDDAATERLFASSIEADLRIAAHDGGILAGLKRLLDASAHRYVNGATILPTDIIDGVLDAIDAGAMLAFEVDE